MKAASTNQYGDTRRIPVGLAALIICFDGSDPMWIRSSWWSIVVLVAAVVVRSAAITAPAHAGEGFTLSVNHAAYLVHLQPTTMGQPPKA